MATIESYGRPQRLYRYRSLEHIERELDPIRRGYLFCSPHMKLNDPMEGLFAPSSHFRESINYPVIRNAIRENKAGIGLCSFSEVCDHVLMRAHYADQFRGICIAYSLSRLLKNLGPEISFVRMYYNEVVPTVHRSSRKPDQLAKMVLSYKNHRWLHEREWRMFARPGKVRYHSTDCVTRVYLGSRISAANRDRIRSALDDLSIKIREMSIGEYSIRFRVPSSN